MLGGTIGAFVCTLLIVVFSIISWPPWADAELDERGQAATAFIVSGPHTVSARNGQANRVRLDVEITDGPAAGVRTSVTSAPSPAYRPSQSVTIDVLPDDPSIARIPGDTYGIFGLSVLKWLALPAVVCLMLAAIGFVTRPRPTNV